MSTLSVSTGRQEDAEESECLASLNQDHLELGGRGDLGGRLFILGMTGSLL